MRKTLLFALSFMAVALVSTLAACGDDDDPNEPVVTPVDTTTQKPNEPDEPADTVVTGDASTGWPAQYTGVMLQAFYWDSFDDTQWTELQSQADELSGTFDLVWLPQSGNCGGTSMGYDDLYWFSNYNSSFGNEQQLRSLISTFKSKGIKTIADVVINHRKNVSNWVDFPRETYNGTTYEMTAADICYDDDGGKTRTWAEQNGYSLSNNVDTGEGWGGMRDLDHKSENVQTIVKAYLDFLRNDLGYAGFRYDMVKGYSATFTALYNQSSQPEFSVGECWDGTNTIKRWIDGTKIDGKIQSAAFDFQFRYTVRNACNNAKAWLRLTQQNDGNWPLISNNQDAGAYRRYAVTFVENHDTERRSNAEQDPLKRDTLAANAYMLAMPGTPCVFLKHWQAYPHQIKAMVAARKAAGITNESSYQTFYQQSWAYAATVDGRLMVAVGDSLHRVQPSASQWVKVLEGYHYAYYMPASMQTAYADMPSGTYVGQPTVRLTAVTADATAQIAYSTDGSSPTTIVPSGTTVTLPVGTTTLRFAMVTGGTIGTTIERTYVVKEGAAQQTVTIPDFCTVADGETCAFFESPSSWTETVMCWAWASGGSPNYTGGTWPGQSCTLLGTAANGNKVWKWTYTGTLTTRPAYIIFSNNGSPQTNDLNFTNGGYYTKDGLKGTVSSTR